MIKALLHFTIVLIACAPFLNGEPAVAQLQERQVIVSLNNLPSLQKLRRNSNWTDEDSRVAVNLVRAYLNEVGQEFPIDCRFDYQTMPSTSYALGEDRVTVENRLRRAKVPMVMFKQVGIWDKYPVPETFKPLHEGN